jgi:hypothetical protein
MLGRFPFRGVAKPKDQLLEDGQQSLYMLRIGEVDIREVLFDKRPTLSCHIGPILQVWLELTSSKDVPDLAENVRRQDISKFCARTCANQIRAHARF